MSRIDLTVLVLIAIVAARDARAVDGVIEINHARALAGGVTPGDSAGYPVTISQPGSYRLTGPLTPLNVTAIAITTGDVKLDLNEFRLAPTAGGGGLPGIDATSQTDVEISNGTVASFTGSGIVAGDRATIEKVAVRSNGSFGSAGISVGAASTVTGCLAQGSSGDGIFAGAASTVRGNRAVSNGQAGIHVLSGSVVSGNTANSNSGRGLFVGAGSVVSENAVSFNVLDGITTDAGCSVSRNAAANNGGDGIEVSAGSTVIANTASTNGRCGVNSTGGTSGIAHNVLTSNNGSAGSRQSTGASQLDTWNSATDNIFLTNLCSNGFCGAGTVGNCQ